MKPKYSPGQKVWIARIPKMEPQEVEIKEIYLLEDKEPTYIFDFGAYTESSCFPTKADLINSL